jgi:transposase InsO family protein
MEEAVDKVDMYSALLYSSARQAVDNWRPLDPPKGLDELDDFLNQLEVSLKALDEAIVIAPENVHRSLYASAFSKICYDRHMFAGILSKVGLSLSKTVVNTKDGLLGVPAKIREAVSSRASVVSDANEFFDFSLREGASLKNEWHRLRAIATRSKVPIQLAILRLTRTLEPELASLIRNSNEIIRAKVEDDAASEPAREKALVDLLQMNEVQSVKTTLPQAAPAALVATQGEVFRGRCRKCQKYGHKEAECRSQRREPHQAKRQRRDDPEGKGREHHSLKRKNDSEYSAIFIPVQVGDLRCLALLDSGASISLMKHGLLSQGLEPWDGGRIRGVSKDAQIEAVANIKIKLADSVSVSARVGTVTNLPVDMIIGTDILRSARLSVDFASGVVNDRKGVPIRAALVQYQPTAMTASPTQIPRPSTVDINQAVKHFPEQEIRGGEVWNPRKAAANLLSEFVDIFVTGNDAPPAALVKPVKIRFVGKPSRAAYRRTSDARVNFTRDEIERLLLADKIEESTSPFRSAINVVKEMKDGKPRFRLTIDYRRVNEHIEAPAVPMASIAKETWKLGSAEFFVVADFANGYNQIPICKESREITAFSDFDERLWQWKVLPLGLSASGAHFMAAVARSLQSSLPKSMWTRMTRYVDDLAFGCKNLHSLLEDSRAFFTALRKARFTLKWSKLQFGVRRAKVLGHIVSCDTVSPAQTHIEAILKTPPPRNVSQARSAVSLVGWLREFIDNFHVKSKPFYEAIRSGVFDDRVDRAWEALQDEIRSGKQLGIPKPGLPFTIHTDASKIGVGIVLSQNGRIIRFASKMWANQAQASMAPVDMELAAVVLAIKEWEHVLVDAKFKVLTDNDKVANWRNLNIGVRQDKRARWVELLDSWNPTIEYVPGHRNGLPDLLSRTVSSDKVPAAFAAIPDRNMNVTWSEAQKNDPEFASASSARQSVIRNGVVYWASGTGLRPWVPTSLREGVIRKAHQTLAHPGTSALTRWLKSVCVWKGMSGDAKAFCEGCLDCARVKQPQQFAVLPRQPTFPNQPAVKWGVDIADLPEAEGISKILIAVDLFSGWPEVWPIADARSETIANALVSDLVGRYGKNIEVVTDGAANMTSAELREKLGSVGVVHYVTTPEHQQANGTAEAMVKKVKIALATRLSQEGHHRNWRELLSEVIYAIRWTPLSSTNFAPGEVMFGQRNPAATLGMSIPDHGESIPANEVRDMALARREEKQRSEGEAAQAPYQVNDMVMLFRSNARNLQPNYDGPFFVDKVFNGGRSLELVPSTVVRSRKRLTVSIANVKPFEGRREDFAPRTGVRNAQNLAQPNPQPLPERAPNVESDNPPADGVAPGEEDVESTEAIPADEVPEVVADEAPSEPEPAPAPPPVPVPIGGVMQVEQPKFRDIKASRSSTRFEVEGADGRRTWYTQHELPVEWRPAADQFLSDLNQKAERRAAGTPPIGGGKHFQVVWPGE